MRNWRILSNSTYLESDNELPTCYSLLTKQQLLEAIGTSHDVIEIESDDENEMEKEDTPGEGEHSNETTTLKSFKDVLDSVQNRKCIKSLTQHCFKPN